MRHMSSNVLARENGHTESTNRHSDGKTGVAEAGNEDRSRKVNVEGIVQKGLSSESCNQRPAINNMLYKSEHGRDLDIDSRQKQQRNKNNEDTHVGFCDRKKHSSALFRRI